MVAIELGEPDARWFADTLANVQGPIMSAGSLATLGAASALRYRSYPAHHNFGDGFSYALALELGAAILCKGDDFAKADVPVLAPPRRM